MLKVQTPNGEDKVLLHSCCAPCSGEVMEAMTASGIDYTIFFYNPNIHPEKEYLLRKDENIRFAETHNVPFVDAASQEPLSGRIPLHGPGVECLPGAQVAGAATVR